MNKLIELYCAICHHSEDSRIAEKMQHGSNNKSAQFTDVELMTAYLWGAQQGLLTRKSIYNFIRTYHLGEFQKLPSYQAFCRRLNRLAEAYPDREFTLIIGADNWAAFDRWKSPEEIIRKHSIIVYPRPGYDIQTGPLPPHVKVVDTPQLEISSTFIRQAISEGRDIRYFLHPEVYRIIAEKKLYNQQ